MKVDGISLVSGLTVLLTIEALLLLVPWPFLRVTLSAWAGAYIAVSLKEIGKPLVRR